MPEFDADAISIANGAIVAALLEKLVASGALSKADASEVIRAAIDSVGTRTKNRHRDHATEILSGLLDRWSESDV